MILNEEKAIVKDIKKKINKRRQTKDQHEGEYC